MTALSPQSDSGPAPPPEPAQAPKKSPSPIRRLLALSLRTKATIILAVALASLAGWNALKRPHPVPHETKAAALPPAPVSPKQAAPVVTKSETIPKADMPPKPTATSSNPEADFSIADPVNRSGNGLREVGEATLTKNAAPKEPDEVATHEAAQPTVGRPLSGRRNEKRTLPEIFSMPDPAPAIAATAAAPEPTDMKPTDKEPTDEEPDPVEPAMPKDPTTSLAEDFAPFGRLVKCHLVNTID
jgi:hypothetical protein